MRSLVLISGIFGAFCSFINAVPGQTLNSRKAGDKVSTSSGSVIGHSNSKRPEVSEYLGIPYAKAPVGQLRFAPPVRFTSDAPFEASAFVSDTTTWVSSTIYC